jgi:putative peptide zinc metalloprotease protein
VASDPKTLGSFSLVAVSLNQSVLQPGEFPCLKPGCRFRSETFHGKPFQVLEDPSTGNFFRLGEVEADFLRGLDGSLRIPQILEKTSKLGNRQRGQLLELAARSGLLKGHVTSKPRKASVPPNPLFLKISFGNPERIFDGLERALRPLLSVPVAFVAAALVAAALYTVVMNYSTFVLSLSDVFSIENAPALFVIFVFLKFLHEIGHGVLCHRFGGHISEWGVYLIFFFPLSYVDATSAWGISSKYKRMAVSAAGMGAEILAASVAALVWSFTQDGALRTICANGIVLASITTVIFNGNPFRRFDGYFILADWLEIPNLYAKGSLAASRFLQSAVFGLEQRIPRESFGLIAYGMACLVWRILIVVTICVVAVAVLHGLGAILAAITVAGVLIPQVSQFRKFLASRSSGNLRWAWWKPSLILGLVLVGLFAPLIPPPPASGVICFSELDRVRVKCPGFVEEILVRDGQWVDKGDVLFRLSNPAEEARVGKLLTEAQMSESLALKYGRERRAELQARETARAQGLRRQASEVKDSVSTLQLRSARAGNVIGFRLNDLLGSFQKAGAELAAIGSADFTEVVAAIPQSEVSRISLARGAPVDIYLPGRNLSLHATISSFEQSATQSVRQSALTATGGGPLATRAHTGQVSVEDTLRNRSKTEELVEPVVYVTAEPENAPNLFEGEPCLVRFQGIRWANGWSIIIQRIRDFWDRASQRMSPLDSPRRHP